MDQIIQLHDADEPESHPPLDLEERKDSLVGQIATDIARDVIEGRLPPGADLNSVELAARFKTSRTPVREALMLLEKEGIVEIPPRRRPRVAHISMQEVDELYEIRAVLNGLMIRDYVRAATEEDMQRMEGIFAEMAKAARQGDMPAFTNARSVLHNFWVDRCGNGSLQRLLRTWKMRMSVRRLGGNSSASKDRMILDNERLVLACRERDAGLAETLIISMTRYGLEMIRQQQRAREQENSVPVRA